MTKVTMTVALGAPENDSFPEGEGWMCLLRYQARVMSVPFYMGPALAREPEVSEVLYSLFMDDPDGQSFEDWASDYGYDVDSRNAERTYNLCRFNTLRLQRLLGADYESIRSSVMDDES